MADLVFVVVIIGFFALCAALVVGCDRIVRADDSGDQPEGVELVDVTEEVPA